MNYRYIGSPIHAFIARAGKSAVKLVMAAE
jgi:hypothetical protein